MGIARGARGALYKCGNFFFVKLVFIAFLARACNPSVVLVAGYVFDGCK